MNSKSQSRALLSVVASLVLSSSAYYFGSGWEGRIVPLKTQITQLQSDKSKIEAEVLQLQGDSTEGASSALPLEPTFMAAVTEISQAAEAHNVQLALPLLTSSDGISVPPNTGIDQAAESVGGSSLKTLRINYKGEYAYYEEFKQFIAGVQNERRVISYLKVDGRGFEFSILVFGQ